MFQFIKNMFIRKKQEPIQIKSYAREVSRNMYLDSRQNSDDQDLVRNLVVLDLMTNHDMPIVPEVHQEKSPSFGHEPSDFVSSDFSSSSSDLVSSDFSSSSGGDD